VSKTNHLSRESWLQAAVGLARPLFGSAGLSLPEVRVACGWPHTGGTAKKKRRIGECWDPTCATDGVSQIFISPYLDDAVGSQGVLATLVHELLHAAVGLKCGHKGPFKKNMEKVGLTGKATATSASEELQVRFASWMESLGDYPNSKLDLAAIEKKKQSTRLLKCECPECGYVCRTTKKWLDEVGAPHCPRHGEMKAEIPGEDDGSDDDE